MSEHVGDDDWTADATAELSLQGSTTEPAVGLDVSGADADAVAGSVLRAYRHGQEPLVAHSGELDADVRAVLRQLDVPLVDAAERPVEESLVESARGAGFPGLVLHRDLDRPVDYDRSREALLDESARYAVDAVYESETGSEPFVVVGIPAYNESTTIGTVVHRARRHADEVVVVDDGSSDDTATIAADAGATVIEHDVNQGKGAAVRSLIDHVEGLDCDALVTLDGDGQHDPSQLPELVGPVVEGEADIAIGSRYLDGDGAGETPRYRRLGQRTLDALTRSSSGLAISDSQSGFRALSPAAIERLRLHSTGFEVESEMIDAATRADLEVVERPIEVRYDGVDGSTANPFHHGLAVVAFILQLVRDRHPLLFFGLPGVVLTLAGIGYGIDGYLIYRSTGTFYPVKAIVSGFLTIIGAVGVFTGFVLNSIAHMVVDVRPRED